jgi:hypothetical protein
MGWLTAIGIGMQLFKGLRGYQQSKSAGNAAYQQGMWNSQQASYFGNLNANAIAEAAGHNASMTMAIGELNAWYIERAGERNLKMYGIQADEELRRHVRAEKMTAGSIRAAQSGSGIQVNTGSNLRYLNDQIDEGLNQRHFMMVRHAETKKSIRMDFEDKAFVTRESARLQAEAIAANGAIGAEMARAEAQYKSSQYAREALEYQQKANSDAFSSLLSGVGSAFTFGLQRGAFDGFSLKGISNFFSGGTPAQAPSALASPSSTLAPPTYLSQNARPYGTPVYSHRWASDFLTGVL